MVHRGRVFHVNFSPLFTCGIMAKETKVAVPKEAQVMGAILKDMGITEYDPGVINQMLEFTYSELSFHLFKS